MSSKVLLPFIEVDIADREEKMYLFAISLLGTTIQDGGKEERSNDHMTLYCQNKEEKNENKYKSSECTMTS